MTYRDEITADYVRTILDYDPETGVMKWAVDRHPVKAGQLINRVGSTGYIIVMINRRHYKVHRLAFLMMTGSWPSKRIDHANRVKTDNRWCNLREATPLQSNGNVSTANKTGFKGVSWDKRKKKWKAQGRVNGKNVWLGRFNSPEAAHAAYIEWATSVFGEFACA